VEPGMSRGRSIGYIGVDVLNNATICNEAIGLIQAGVPLNIVSVRRFEQPTFYRDESLELLRGRIHTLYPLGPFAVLWAFLCAPWYFGWRFWKTLGKLLTSPCEGWRQRIRLIWHLVPAVCLAVYWRKKSIGHIHAHWAHTATSIAMHTAELLGIGFSFTGHANDLFVHRVALSAKIKRARFIVCISEFHRRFYLDRGADPKRLHVVYCGIDTDRFCTTAKEETPLAIPVILGVGRLVEKKGFHHLIEGCALLSKRGVPFHCHIAGSGPEEQRLQSLIDTHGLGDRVRVSGRTVLQEELAPLLRSATIFALPCVRDREGDMDGLPQVLIEAMACGLPVVSTRMVGIPDLVQSGANGLLVEAEDTRAFAEAMERLLLNPGMLTHDVDRVAAWVQLHFSREETVRRLKQLFLWAAKSEDQMPDFHWRGTSEVGNLSPPESAGQPVSLVS